MDTEKLLPKRTLAYIHDMGVRGIDKLAETFEVPAGEEPGAIGRLVEHWRTMTAEEKEDFVQRAASATLDVIAASAVLPLGLKLGKRAAKATGKVIRKKSRKLRKAARRALGGNAGKSGKNKKDKKKRK